MECPDVNMYCHSGNIEEWTLVMPVGTCLARLRRPVEFVVLYGGDVEQLPTAPQSTEIFVILEYFGGNQRVPHQVVILGIMQKDTITEI